MSKHVLQNRTKGVQQGSAIMVQVNSCRPFFWLNSAFHDVSFKEGNVHIDKMVQKVLAEAPPTELYACKVIETCNTFSLKALKTVSRCVSTKTIFVSEVQNHKAHTGGCLVQQDTTPVGKTLFKYEFIYTPTAIHEKPGTHSNAYSITLVTSSKIYCR